MEDEFNPRVDPYEKMLENFEKAHANKENKLRL
jgi:hypothetical protein